MKRAMAEYWIQHLAFENTLSYFKHAIFDGSGHQLTGLPHLFKDCLQNFWIAIFQMKNKRKNFQKFYEVFHRSLLIYQTLEMFLLFVICYQNYTVCKHSCNLAHTDYVKFFLSYNYLDIPTYPIRISRMHIFLLTNLSS